MPDFDAALDHQSTLAIWAWVAFYDIAQVGHLRNGQVTFPVDAEIVLVVDVGTNAEVAHQCNRTVDDARQGQVQWAERTGAGANGVTQFVVGGHDQRAGNLFQVGGLDFVELVVATDDQGNQLAFFGGVHDQGLDGLFDRQVVVFHQLRNGLGIRGVDQAQFFARRRAHGFPWNGLGLLDIGGVVGAVAEDHVVFTGLCQYMEFVGVATADRAGVGLHRTEVQAQAGKDVAVGQVHAVVGFLQGSLVGMEGVGVLHDELAATHQAEARTDFVTELGLDLVHVQRQLFIAVELVAGQVGDHFFVGWAHAEVTTVAVFQAQQLWAVLFPTTGFLPQLGRLDARHQHFQGAGGVHFFADHGLNLAHYPKAHRQPGIKAGCELADHAGPQHELVADDDRVGRGFFLGSEQILTGAHGRPLSVA
ncbi:hypothetical protein D3C80_596940 [compost metagenome]